jgi:subtilisin family serine protease
MSVTLRLPAVALMVLVSGAPMLRADDVSPLARLGADAWHAHKLTGAGITVAVLDSGFRGYREHLGNALPKQVRTKSFRVDGNLEAKDSPHGVLCAEIIHTLAPDAQLLFANWESDCPDAFLNAVKWCRAQGAVIMTCSIIMPGWSDGHGGGNIHRELAHDLGDALFFASAGNLAQRHWSGTFQDDGRHLHQWQAGRTDNVVRPWGRQPVSVEATWPAASNCRLVVRDERGQSVGQEQALGGRGVHGSAVRFLPDGDSAYRARLELVDESGGDVRLIVLGGELEFATTDGCMVFPGDGPEVIAVGAVSADGTRLASSSTGWPGANVKPDCVAPVPFPSRVRAEPFGGTSAAAPQAAAAAALLWSRDRQANAAAIGEILRKNCVDVGPPGPDRETGYGQIRLPRP